MKKLVAATAVIAMFSFTQGAFAQTAPGGSGTIKFTGEIVAGACGISPGTADQTVPLGQVPVSLFTNAGDRSSPESFDIVLTDCNTAVAGTAKFTFSGQAPVAKPDLFAVNGGAQNVGLRLQASNGDNLNNGVIQANEIKLQNGDNTVTFSAMYEAITADVVPGEADATTNFIVTYL
ncbi:fimbrial protein [Collimonas sp. NPDC087041]|uniref:fimbrial protein n=1 Tax=Collimonas sp. NPDC087041 TaxID=3363960 RepID=UPI0038118460